MKLNNRGFAISSIMYIILVLAVVLIALTLSILSSRKLILDKLRNEVSEDIHYKVCKLTRGEPNAIGSKYQCKVNKTKDIRYNFYVLSYNDANGNITNDIAQAVTTNLIMERNICNDGTVATSDKRCLVAWYAPADDNSYGPVTAMQYLHNATKDWDNIPNMIMNYEDENIDYDTQQKGTNGYGSIVTTATTTVITSKTNEETGRIENLKTRMPRYDEVHGIGKCLTYSENGNQYGSCPLWLSNYLHSSSYVTGEGLQNIIAIFGYWILSSNANNSYRAWLVEHEGYVNYYDVNDGDYYGVRPVITLGI